MINKEQKITLESLTLYEDEFHKVNGQSQNYIQILIFRLSSEWYAIELGDVKEIVKLSKITYLPLAPKQISGIINLRGRIFSVTDLKKVFNLAKEELSENSRLIMIESDNMETGLCADEVTTVANISPDKIDPPINTISSDIKNFIRGEIRIGKKIIILLNLEQLFFRT